MQHQHVVPYPAIGRPASGGYAWGYRGGYAGGYRIPQLYPPARVQIPTQIQSASRSLGEQNQPRLAPRGSAPRAPLVPPPVPVSFSKNSVFLLRSLLTIMAFSQMDVVASLGVLLRWSRPRCASLWLRIQNVKRELCTRVAPFDEEPGSALKRNRFEICQ